MVCNADVFRLAILTRVKLYPMTFYAVCAQVVFPLFLFLAEGILRSGNEGSLSSDSDDEYDLSQGRWCLG